VYFGSGYAVRSYCILGDLWKNGLSKHLKNTAPKQGFIIEGESVAIMFCESVYVFEIPIEVILSTLPFWNNHASYGYFAIFQNPWCFPTDAQQVTFLCRKMGLHGNIFWFGNTDCDSALFMSASLLRPTAHRNAFITRHSPFCGIETRGDGISHKDKRSVGQIA